MVNSRNRSLQVRENELQFTIYCMSTLLERKGDLLDVKVPLLTRIKFPRVWKRLPGGIRVEDLQEDKFDEALEHIKIFYFRDETLCGLSRLTEDVESVEYYLKIIRWWMQDTQSLVAVTEDTGKIIGLIIERVLDLYLMKTMSRVMNYNGEALRKMQKFLIHMSKTVDINKEFNSEHYNQIFIWSVDPSYRGMGIGKGLLQACIDQTKSFKLTILTGIFTSVMTQSIARNEGFYSLLEMPYKNWKEKSQIVFEDIDLKDNSAKLMALNFNNMDYNRNKCEEILQKYKISKLSSIKTLKKKIKEQ